MTYISFMGHPCAPFCIPNSIQLNPLLGVFFFFLIQTKQKIIFQNRRLVVYIHSYLVLRKLSKKHCSLCTSESAERAGSGKLQREEAGSGDRSSLIKVCAVEWPRVQVWFQDVKLLLFFFFFFWTYICFSCRFIWLSRRPSAPEIP